MAGAASGVQFGRFREDVAARALAAGPDAELGCFAQALLRAAQTAGLGALLRRRRGRLTLAIGLARCVSACALGLLRSSSIALMYDLVRRGLRGGSPARLAPDEEREDAGALDGQSTRTTASAVHRRVQRFTTNIGTIVTLIDFLTSPLIGNFMDAYGRLPTMLCGLATTALTRLSLAVRPSLGLYAAYRLTTAISQPAFLRAADAAMRDLYGRGTADYEVANSLVSRYALLSMLAGTFAGRAIRQPRHAFVICGATQLAGVLALASVTRETLTARSQMQWTLQKINPLAFIAFYGHSGVLAAFAVMRLFSEIPGQMGIDAVYQRHRFPDWGRAQDSNQTVMAQLSGVLSTFVTVPLLELLGLRGVTRLHSWIDVLTNLNTALAPRMELLYLNSVACVFQCGGQAVERGLQQEATLLGLGAGELGAAEASRRFIPSLVFPHVFTSIFARCADRAPAVPYALVAVLAIFAAEVVTPWAFSRASAAGAAGPPGSSWRLGRHEPPRS